MQSLVAYVAKETENTIAADPINGVDHELLEATVTVKQAGYLYIYLSNEEESPVDVFFDDFEVVHTKGPVVQSEEYYPFGLTFNSYQRENVIGQGYLFNGKEVQDELGLGWQDYGSRMYMNDIGRWGVVDRESDLFVTVTPYSYSLDNPVVLCDPDGSKVRPTNQAALELIQNTLTAEDAAYVKLNEYGMIDGGLLNLRQSDSGNFNSLKALVNAEGVYEVAVTKSFAYIDENGKRRRMRFGETYVDKPESPDYGGPYYPDGQAPSTGEVGYLGQTLHPRNNKEDDKLRSTNNNTKIYISKNLRNKLTGVEAFAHEMYGHAKFRLDGKNTKHMTREEHDTDFEGNQGDLLRIVDMNHPLVTEIVKRVNEAIKNYNDRIEEDKK